MTILGVVGDPPRDGWDLDYHKKSSMRNFSSVQNFRPLGAVEAFNSYNGVGSLGREGHFVCYLELLHN